MRQAGARTALLYLGLACDVKTAVCPDFCSFTLSDEKGWKCSFPRFKKVKCFLGSKTGGFAEITAGDPTELRSDNRPGRVPKGPCAASPGPRPISVAGIFEIGFDALETL